MSSCSVTLFRYPLSSSGIIIDAFNSAFYLACTVSECVCALVCVWMYFMFGLLYLLTFAQGRSVYSQLPAANTFKNGATDTRRSPRGQAAGKGTRSRERRDGWGGRLRGESRCLIRLGVDADSKFVSQERQVTVTILRSCHKHFL